jgi:hypothetical protein
MHNQPVSGWDTHILVLGSKQEASIEARINCSPDRGYSLGFKRDSKLN